MQSKKNHFDIIILGAGLAGLSLAYRALQAGIWDDQCILIIDGQQKNTNDKTWSFWQSGNGSFDHLICKSWQDLSFFSTSGEELLLNTGDYAYHTIHSLDFYNATLKALEKYNNVSFIFETVVDFSSADGTCLVRTNSGIYSCNYIFNSLFEKPKLPAGGQYFLQHFKGITLQIDKHGLDVNRAFLMDFRTTQEAGTSFFYTLPLSDDLIFIEYTLFSKSLLDDTVYDSKLTSYIHDILGLNNYIILEKEFGVIPMTDYNFTRFNEKVTHIGTIGGDTRGATGYTFTNIQKTVSEIIMHWEKFKNPFFNSRQIGAKELMYDGTLLNVLDQGRYPGHQLFYDLFKGVPAYRIFAFLDAETNLIADLTIIKSLRPMPFVSGLISYLYHKIRKHK
ncbi:lycopene cyclase family protein [Pedobacter duraquae]|uniref:Lycopene beta-cyclase n=1 Tax=Pedobacter duraquae TaxID=425511 RepID=A0A4R6IQ03_9SPHI|nr:lycopene cyclase family protein [Pedobacter duraquae]TDO24086.1 lycopene beta-cyclase [Pedobacter duraquae]